MSVVSDVPSVRGWRQGWDDLAILAADGPRRRPNFWIVATLLFAILGTALWPTPGIAASVLAGALLGRRWLTSGGRVAAGAVLFAALSVATVFLFDVFHLVAPREHDAPMALMQANAGFACALALTVGQGRVALFTLSGAGWLAVVPFATWMQTASSDRTLLEFVWAVALIAQVFGYVCCTRAALGGWRLIALAVALASGSLVDAQTGGFLWAPISVNVIVGAALALAAAAFAHADGGYGASGPPLDEVRRRNDRDTTWRRALDAALARTVRRLQLHPLRVACIVLPVVGVLTFSLMIDVLGTAGFGTSQALGMTFEDRTGTTLVVSFGLLLYAPAVVGALLGRSLPRGRTAFGGLAVSALAAVTFALTLIAFAMHPSGVVFRGGTGLFFAVGAGAIPAALGVWSGQWRVVPSRTSVLFGFVLFVVLLALAPIFLPLGLLALAGLAVLIQFAMSSRLLWWQAALAVLLGWGASLVLLALLPDDLVAASLRAPVLSFALLAVIPVWPIIAVGRRLGSATAVPLEHPIYVDFGGPAQTEVGSELP